MKFNKQQELDEPKFYAQKELDELHKSMKQIPYKNKNKWQKFLSDNASIQSKKQSDIWECEVPLEELDNH